MYTYVRKTENICKNQFMRCVRLRKEHFKVSLIYPKHVSAKYTGPQWQKYQNVQESSKFVRKTHSFQEVNVMVPAITMYFNLSN